MLTLFRNHFLAFAFLEVTEQVFLMSLILGIDYTYYPSNPTVMLVESFKIDISIRESSIRLYRNYAEVNVQSPKNRRIAN